MGANLFCALHNALTQQECFHRRVKRKTPPKNLVHGTRPEQVMPNLVSGNAAHLNYLKAVLMLVRPHSADRQLSSYFACDAGTIICFNIIPVFVSMTDTLTRSASIS